MTDQRINTLPSLGLITGAEYAAVDDATTGTTKVSLSDVLAWISGLLPTSQGVDFVYRPGGPSVGNVFGTFAALHAAVSALPAGMPARIFLDGSFTAGLVTVPAGLWNFISDYQLIGVPDPSTGRPTLVLANGCNFLRWPSMISSVTIDDQNTTIPAFRAQGFGVACETRLFLVDHASSAGLPLLYTSVFGTPPKLYLFESTALTAPLASSLVAGMGMEVWVSAGSSMGPNVLESPISTTSITVDASSRGAKTQVGGAGLYRTRWSSQAVFYYHPSVTPYYANEYDDWTELSAAVDSIIGEVVIVFAEDVTISENTGYNFGSKVRWLGSPNVLAGGTRPVVTVAPNIQILGLSSVENLLVRCQDGTLPGGLFRSPSGAVAWAMDWINADGEAMGATESIYYHTTPGTLTLRLYGNSTFFFSGGAPAILLAGTGSMVVEMYDAANIDANMIQSPVGYAVQIRYLSAAASIGSQALMGTPPSEFIGPQDQLVRHIVTSDAGKWAGSAPATVQEAIARLAVAVEGLLGAPIP